MPSKRKRTASKAKVSPSAPSSLPLPSEPIRTLSGNAESSFIPLAKKFLVPLATIIVLAVAASFFYPFLGNQTGNASYQPPAGANGNQQPQGGVQSSGSPASQQAPSAPVVPPSTIANNSTSPLSNASASNGSGSDSQTLPPSANGAGDAGNSGGTITSGTISGTQGSSSQNGGSNQQPAGNEQGGQNNSGGSGDSQDIIEPPLSTPDSPYATYFGITTGTLANATYGSQYSFSLTAVGGTGSYTWYTSTLPPGLSLSQSGVIYGVPTQPGVYNVQITVSDGISASTQFLRITVN